MASGHEVVGSNPTGSTIISKSLNKAGSFGSAFFVQFDHELSTSYDQRLLLLMISQAIPRKLSNSAINR